jgi:hypothetical protein
LDTLIDFTVQRDNSLCGQRWWRNGDELEEIYSGRLWWVIDGLVMAGRKRGQEGMIWKEDFKGSIQQEK